jgi:hypothetical protein
VRENNPVCTLVLLTIRRHEKMVHQVFVRVRIRRQETQSINGRDGRLLTDSDFPKSGAKAIENSI